MPGPQARAIALAGVALLDASLSATQFAAQFAPIPALAPAVATLQFIVQSCQNIVSNKSEVRQLQERCRYLIISISDPDGDSSMGEEMDRTAAGCASCLQSVLNLISKYAEYNRWQLFTHQAQISKDIRKCHVEIDDCCREFQIRSDIRLHQWQNEHERARKQDHEELIETLESLGESANEILSIVSTQSDTTREILRLLQQNLAVSEQGSTKYQHLEASTHALQTRSGELLPELDLPGKEAKRVGRHPVAGNAAFDIWEGLWLGRDKVAMKTIRSVQVAPNTQKRFIREAEIWRQVWEQDRGKYILPLYGIVFYDGPFPYLVSPWMSNGNVMDYITKYPCCNRREIVKGIAKGLLLLHNFTPNPIAHGDLKGANILIDDSGQPLLADFGLSKIMENFTGVPFTQSKGVSESYRWFAPEMCCSPGLISTRSDVFSFAMTMIEIFTGQPPYDHIRLTTEVLFRMQNGERPQRPTSPEVISRGFDDKLWMVAVGCWDPVPENRPSINRVLDYL